MSSDQPGMSNPIAVEDLLEQVAGSRTILVAASDSSSADYAETLDVAIALAERLDAKLVLVDRSQATFGDTSHVEGPMSGAQAAADGRSHLLDQGAAARAAGVREVELWATSMPTVDGVGEVVMTVAADVVVIPATMHDPSLVERITLRRLPEKVVESGRSMRREFHIVAVGTDGELRLVT